jgi:hypothetical protein
MAPCQNNVFFFAAKKGKVMPYKDAKMQNLLRLVFLEEG